MDRSRRSPDRRPLPAGEDEAASAPRIIGGDLRGRFLEFTPAARTRPMKERVRESLFNLLGVDVKGRAAIDLFAGTGALGFEAVSRGAIRAVLAERHFPTADVLRRSARSLGIENRVEVRPGDVLLWAKRLPPLPAEMPWVVFVSPPWSFSPSGGENSGP
jgi:16S rRNA (guanine966-N2)-methyltransferase